MTRSNFLAIAGLSMAILCSPSQDLQAQDKDLSGKISGFLGDNGTKYIQPAVDAFSANLNSGLYHRADVHHFLSFEIGLVAMAAPIPGRMKTFQAILPDTIRYQNKTYIVGRDYDRVITTPTAVGSKSGTKVFSKQGKQGDPPIYESPGGTNLKLFPILAPQLSVGLPHGTEFIVRYVPEIKLSGDVGKLKLVGGGFRHSISQWLSGPSLVNAPKLNEFPLDISLNLMYQEFTLTDSSGGDFLKTKVFSMGVQASKEFLILTLYGGLAYENAKTNISYVYHPTTPSSQSAGDLSFPIRLNDLKGENNFRATVGLNLHLVFMDVFADYSVASQPVASAGVVLTFR